jgi:hypothetical protein
MDAGDRGKRRGVWNSPLRLMNLRLGLLINFGAELIGEGISRVANGLPAES